MLCLHWRNWRLVPLTLLLLYELATWSTFACLLLTFFKALQPLVGECLAQSDPAAAICKAQSKFPAMIAGHAITGGIKMAVHVDLRSYASPAQTCTKLYTQLFLA